MKTSEMKWRRQKNGAEQAKNNFNAGINGLTQMECNKIFIKLEFIGMF